MQLTIFHRLIAGYLFIILIMGSLDAFIIERLRSLNREVSRILDVDGRILDLQQKLASSIISQSGYERKYRVTGDKAFRDRFLVSEKDFDRHLAESLSLADTVEKRDLLALIKSRYEGYRSAARKRMEQTTRQRGEAGEKDAQEEDQAVEEILADLRSLKSIGNRNIEAGIGGLRAAAGSIARVTIIIVAVSTLLAVFASVMVARSITSPLKTLIRKTNEVSSGIFRGGLRIESPPEISELAKTFDLMCERLGQVEKVKSEFFSSVSHELRTPLTVIKSGISLLCQEGYTTTPEKQQKLLSILTEESNRLIALVNSVLDLSKMEAGMMHYDRRQEQLVQLVEQVMEEVTPLLDARKIELTADLERDIPPLQVDRERILQVLRNLIGNALKFTPKGGWVRISVHLKDRMAVFSVKDSGPGIPAENLEAIFEKFHQASADASKQMKGTGLGLAIVKHIITSHGGRVWAESEAGHGSTFIFTLPC